MLKAVLFDFYQTLVNSANGFRTAERWIQRRLFEWLDLPDWNLFIGAYRRIRAEEGGNSPAHKVRQWHKVCRHFNVELQDTLLSTWEAEYWDRVDAETRLLPDTMPVLGELRRHFKVGLLTNASTVHERGRHVEQFRSLMAMFDSVIVGGTNDILLKPNPDGFRKLLAALGVSPGEAVFVGDDWTDDICGARDAGIFPVWLRHASIPRQPIKEVPADIVLIDSLHPLRNLCAGDSLDDIRRKLNRRLRTGKDTTPKGAFT